MNSCNRLSSQDVSSFPPFSQLLFRDGAACLYSCCLSFGCILRPAACLTPTLLGNAVAGGLLPTRRLTRESITALLFTVTRAPRYFGILQDHRGQPLSVEVSEEYMDQDYIATNRKRHKIDWNKLFSLVRNPLDMDDFDDDDTEEIFDDKDKDVKVPNKYNLQAGPV
ncbi:unnamed protein product [Chrysodeixis includens]|uniref:Uncharacterized protein n=1 Tax=Chrysodeixis includens TaxID=689277 RepID=A0A9N8L3F5_CHRIL|nr:unnamed protein product [Chrysodeixis includens]